jgi:hypothetical protein
MATDSQFAEQPEVFTADMNEIFSIHKKEFYTKFVSVL